VTSVDEDSHAGRLDGRQALDAPWEWTSDDGTTERFFDYVLKKTFKN
jgi:hypothetical protein